jgi:hypothetical protein
VAACQRAVSSHEFTDWVAYDRLAPLNRTELLIAQLYTLMLNVYRDTKAHPRPFEVEDILTTPAARALEQASDPVIEWNEYLAQLRALARQRPN